MRIYLCQMYELCTTVASRAFRFVFVLSSCKFEMFSEGEFPLLRWLLEQFITRDTRGPGIGASVRVRRESLHAMYPFCFVRHIGFERSLKPLKELA